MIPPWQKSKYSVVEREKRFLVKELPAHLLVTKYHLIEDRYFPETRLRLRKITDRTGTVVALKLTQKFLGQGQLSQSQLSQGQNDSERNITNFYLNEREYWLFASLSGASLLKRRYDYEVAGQTYAIDVFEGHLAGLILAEIEYSEREVEPSLPSFAFKDVTKHSFFTGGTLAKLSLEIFRSEFESYL
jgi:CYTH domain-containing protein